MLKAKKKQLDFKISYDDSVSENEVLANFVKKDADSEDEFLINLKSADDSSDNEVLINLKSHKKELDFNILNKKVAMDTPNLRRSTRKRVPVRKFTSLVDANDESDSDDTKRKLYYGKKRVSDSDTDYEMSHSKSSDDNCEEESSSDDNEQNRTHGNEKMNGVNGNGKCPANFPKGTAFTNYSSPLKIDKFNPYVVLDLNFSSKRNTNDSENSTVKKIFNLRSSAKKKKPERNNKLSDVVSKHRSSDSKKSRRKTIPDNDKSKEAINSDDNSHSEDSKKGKNVKFKVKTRNRNSSKQVSDGGISDVSDQGEEELPKVKVGKIKDDADLKNSPIDERHDSEDISDVEPIDPTPLEDNGVQGDENKENEDNVIPARVLMSSGLDDGQAIYGFVTPKRKDALAKIAQDVIDSSRKSARKSAKRSHSKSSSTVKGKRTASNDVDDSVKEKINSVGRKMRNRVTLAHTLAAEEESDVSEEDDSEYDESDSDENTSDRKKKTEDRDLLDEYFEVHSKAKNVTSDKTLAKLKQPKMDRQELLAHLKDIQSSHVEETIKLHSLHHQHFEKWMFQLLSGFNVLLYGLGSKHMLMEKFRKKMLQDRAHVVVNGFFPSIQLKQILKMITHDVLDRETMFKNTVVHYKYIKEEYDSGTAGKLFILLHNIDGLMLRSQNVQAALGHLASSKNIHLVASIDHINAPLIWDQNRASAFNWLWYDVTTFEPYSEETSYENSLMVQQTGTLALSSLKHVLHSLTSNAKGIFRVVADYHLDNEDNNSYQGISFNDLYQRCRERFLVNSDLALRAQLTEFKDHKLLKTKKGYDGVEYLSVALDCTTLKTFLEEEDG